MTETCRSAALLAAVLLGVGGPAFSQSAPGQPLDETALDGLRGGYMTAAGVRFDFGASVRTYVDGTLALESRLTWTDEGPKTTHAGNAVLDPATLDQLGLAGLSDGRGVVIQGDGGAAALIHALDGQGLRGIIVNSADGMDLRQEIEIDLTLPDLDAIQGAAGIDRLGAQINQDMTAAALRASGG